MHKYIEELERVLAENNEDQNDINAAVEYAQNLISLNLPVVFNKQHFSLLVGCEEEIINKMMASLEKCYYHEAIIPKKNGGVRTLNVPAVELRRIQRWILDNILNGLSVSEYAMGFCNRKSIVTNAAIHMGKKCVVNMDLKDFFPSIKQKKVFNIFYYYGYTIGVSYMLSRLCTYNGGLPQGAPTSPCLSNIVCKKLDKRLSQLAKKYQADYSRYADDITFSGNTNISNIVPIVKRIVEDEGFVLNEEKTRIAFSYQRQEVTGLLVNGNKVRVNKKYIKHLKQEIYYCKKYGAVDHLEHIKCTKRFYKEHMYGKAYFVYMVDKESGKKLIKELDSINWDWEVPRGLQNKCN